MLRPRMSPPRDHHSPHYIRCACPIYFSLKITDFKLRDIICPAISVMRLISYVENFENLCLSKPSSINRSLEQVCTFWDGVSKELYEGLNKNLHLLFPGLGRVPGFSICSKSYHQANKHTHQHKGMHF